MDNVDAWGKLIQATEEQEGGVNRNSHPQAIASTRETYDFLLARFPLFFGYWKKYAQFEWLIGGSETADVVSHFPVHIPVKRDLTLERYSSAASLASDLRSICGRNTVPSRSTPATTRTSFESKFNRSASPYLLPTPFFIPVVDGSLSARLRQQQ